MMNDPTRLLMMEARALTRLGVLAGQLVEVESECKEAILAEMQFQRWLAESCQMVRDAW